ASSFCKKPSAISKFALTSTPNILAASAASVFRVDAVPLVNHQGIALLFYCGVGRIYPGLRNRIPNTLNFKFRLLLIGPGASAT
ncbi:MAG: hypothetical protein ACKOU7_08925, partial [Ferruginibacter sp.]